MEVKRYEHNPIILPDPGNKFEARAVFNGSVQRVNSAFEMVYRAESKQSLSTIGYAKSTSGIDFDGHRQLIIPAQEWEKYGCEDPRLTFFEGKYYVCYTAISAWPPRADSIKCAIAHTTSLEQDFVKHLVTPFNAKAMAIFPERVNGKIAVILSVNTDIPPSKICLALFDEIEQIWDSQYWIKWYTELDSHIIPLKKKTTDQLEVGAVPIRTEKGWLLVFSRIENYSNPNRVFRIDAAVLDSNNPQKVLTQTLEPLLKPTEKYETEGMIPNVIFPSGALIDGDRLNIYYGACDQTICLASVNLKDLFSSMESFA